MEHVKNKIKFDLIGRDGNAYSLMGAWQIEAKKQAVPSEEIEAVMNECMSADYDHLLQTLMANSQ